MKRLAAIATLALSVSGQAQADRLSIASMIDATDGVEIEATGRLIPFARTTVLFRDGETSASFQVRLLVPPDQIRQADDCPNTYLNSGCEVRIEAETLVEGGDIVLLITDLEFLPSE